MILVIDNYDSFTWNIVQYLAVNGAEVLVKRNDEVTVDEVRTMRPGAIVVSPGPGTPSEAGISVPLIRELGPLIPTLGVCLGHQSIADAFGGRVIRAGRVMHGKTSRVLHDGTGLFSSLPSPLEVMRYHSLVIDPGCVPPALEVIATAADNPEEVHAVRHRTHPVWGVQFHPESIMTHGGNTLLVNFLDLAQRHAAGVKRATPSPTAGIETAR
ncbi:MAG: anthranilate synthase component II [Gemmatimonadota bacterium]